MVLDHFYDVRVVHDAMRQRDLLDPQRLKLWTSVGNRETRR